VIDLLQLDGVSPIGQKFEEGNLLIVADSIVAAPLQCTSCGNSPVYKHGKRKYQYADIPMRGSPVTVEIEKQRYRCRACGTVITPEVPSLDDKRVATKRLVEYIQGRCFGTTFTLLARETGLVVNTVKAIAMDYAELLEAHSCRETPRFMGIDEVMISGDYRAVITNLEMRTLFEVYEKRTLSRIREFFKKLKNKEKVEWVAADMWEPYKIIINEQLPDARLVIDKFHVVRMASDALEKICIDLQKSMSKEERLLMKKGMRWPLLRGYDNRSSGNLEHIDYVRQNHPKLALAFDLKEQFFQIYECKTRTDGERAFDDWRKSIPSEFQQSFGQVAATVDRHSRDIFNYFDSPITNGYAEATNGVMKAANEMGRGYSFEVIRAKLMFSKVPMQTGKVISHDGNATDIQQPASTWGKQLSRNYGSFIPTLDNLAERGELE
jgi:transposase